MASIRQTLHAVIGVAVDLGGLPIVHGAYLRYETVIPRPCGRVLRRGIVPQVLPEKLGRTELCLDLGCPAVYVIGEALGAVVSEAL